MNTLDILADLVDKAMMIVGALFLFVKILQAISY